MQDGLRKCSIFQRSHCQRTGSDDFGNATRKSYKIASKINGKSMSEASVKRVLQLVALRRVFEGIFERLGARNGANMEPKGLPKWRQNRCQNRSRAEVASREGSGGPRDAPSPLLETILVPFWCQIGSIWELRSPPGTSKSFQKHPKTTFRFTDPLQPHVRPIFLK